VTERKIKNIEFKMMISTVGTYEDLMTHHQPTYKDKGQYTQ
jgi:hypothetical protein